MSDLMEKCEVCRALLDEEDLFCANCGTEAPDRDTTGEAVAATTLSFECRGCGASMSYDASVGSLRCPFCGSEQIDERPETRVLAPRRIVPFAIDRDHADRVLRRWLGSGFWRPGDLSYRATVTQMAMVYVPYWIFAASTHTHWTADTNELPLGARGDWRPVAGEHHGHYQGVLIGASSALTPAETNAICPFDLAGAVPPERRMLGESVVEQFRVQRKYARPLARHGLERLETEACRQYVPGRSRNLKVNVRLENLTSEPVLLPVWIMAYRYRDDLYRFLINGQSGKSTGRAPVSWAKIAVAVGVGAFVLVLILLGLGALAML